jgi:ATP-binding cassette subfamily B protein
MKTTLAMIRRIAGSQTRRLILPVVFACVESLLQAAMYGAMIATILDLLAGGFTQDRLILYTLIVAATFLVRCVFTAVNYVQTQYRGAEITESLRLTLGDHIRSLNLGYFNSNSIGTLVSALTTDISDFEVVLTHSLATFFKIVFFSVVALAFSFVIDWRFALIVLAIILLSLPLMGVSARVAKRRGGVLRSAIHGVISRVVEYISGIKTFRLYNLTGKKFRRLDDSFQELKRASIKMELSVMPYAIGFSTLTSWIIPVALVAGTLLFGQGLAAAQVIALIMIALALSAMMTSLGSLYPEMAFLNRAGESIVRIMDEKPLGGEKHLGDAWSLEDAEGVRSREAWDKGTVHLSCPTAPSAKMSDTGLNRTDEPSPCPTGNAASPSRYDVAFEHVRFGYADDVEVLHDISFTAKAGSATALVGPSGSGKTTVVSLISRFWDTTGGRITIGGEDIRGVVPDDLTGHMAVVLQDVYLLNDTIENNIKVGKQDATRDEVVAAAQAAQCHEFIAALPQGYDTVVGEGGNTLSGGEKQRVSIARALIKNAPIVLLDETTSSLDADNEREINRALDALMEGRTVIVIAHRLNTVQTADAILVLDKGVIAEQGTHATLLQNGGWYARMIEEQRKARAWAV